ncbi:MAG: MFS transporter [Anaerolineaceae bacterium]|nr:MAG: MFS transporter [Anaerolineaceae bacterium]
MFKSIKKTYHEYTSTFWTLIGAMFIDRLGGSLLFPFFSLYITERFGVGMTEVGYIFMLHTSAMFFGNMLSGALTDKFGRKNMLLAGIILSGTSSLLMGFIPNYETFLIFTVITGLLTNIGGPAVNAMMADILPEKQRAQGFSILRVAVNLSVTFGPAIGGLLAGYNFFYLFVADFVISMITASVVLFKIPETKPKPDKNQHEPEPSLLKTLGGYGIILKDWFFIGILFLTLLTNLVYMQMSSSLSVFLRDMYGISSQKYGYILSLNAIMVVFMQFWITRKISGYRPMLLMFFGNILYAIGFGMYGFVGSYPLFLLAMAIITIGEMISSPILQSIIARLAPNDMRGRYMAVFNLSFGTANAVGPLAAGIIMDNYNPNWVWYAGGIICTVSAFGYLLMQAAAGKKLANPAQKD